MEDIAIKFEAQLVSASMTSSGGHKIVLRINPEDILDNPHNSPAKSIEASRVRSLMLQQPNTRFACALVQMEAESDQPVEPQDIKRATKIGSIVSMLCRSEPEEFSAWLINRYGKEGTVFDKDLTGEQICLWILKDLVGFESRSELKRNPEAVERLEEIVSEYRFE
ncbi:MAG: hypothetical protein GOVbin2729_53 [Prokaryotic dsDNA virus sp.]|nr:MAG: hypothetical protein GOVbin2729_53 [Prokaryotic dsDNA virus sp.]|tara:strand:+ start:13672 stop:14169 length:498 start_codon:yes stop_codon:yes gene_type:complete